MRIESAHGYFKFHEDESGEIARFNTLYGFGLIPKDGYFTFPFIEEAPEHSFENLAYLGLTARESYSGQPWEVFRANEFIYDFNADALSRIETVTTKLELKDAGFYFLSSGLLLPGSFRDDGKRVTDYAARYIWSSSKFRYSWVTFE